MDCTNVAVLGFIEFDGTPRQIHLTPLDGRNVSVIMFAWGQLGAGLLRFRFRKQAEVRGIPGIHDVSMSAPAIGRQLTCEIGRMESTTNLV
jgi:hypothetical protein